MIALTRRTSSIQAKWDVDDSLALDIFVITLVVASVIALFVAAATLYIYAC